MQQDRVFIEYQSPKTRLQRMGRDERIKHARLGYALVGVMILAGLGMSAVLIWGV